MSGNGEFQESSTAGDASIILDGDHFSFGDTATAGNATVAVSGGGGVGFFQSASAGNGVFTVEGGIVSFNDTATAGSGTFITNGGQYGGSGVVFAGPNDLSSRVSAGNATFINNGSRFSDTTGATIFYSGTAAQATLIANGGEAGGPGGFIEITDYADGGEARVEVFGNGYLNVENYGSVTIGSIEGDGIVFLYYTNLSVGSNNASTTFSGDLELGGSLTKIGTGRLVLTKGSSYTGGTTIFEGRLLVENKTGSATGAGPVQINAGVLGGRGIIAGAVTVGHGSGVGAYLAPGQKTSRPGTLTIQSNLTFNSDAIYTCNLNSNTATADKVVANGITITGAALFSPTDSGAATLPPGTAFIVISNTSATPIAGTFSNLADGSTLTVGSNTYLVSYEGGDGNDLTLTVQ